MKKIFHYSVLAILLFLSKASFSNTLHISVDERVELLSIVCQLAEYEEYSNDKDQMGSQQYRDEVKNYFEKYKSDSLISYAKYIRRKHHIAYDAPMHFAVSIEIKDGIRFIPDLETGIEKIDKRWTKQSADRFLTLLNRFYKTTNFRQFFQQHDSIFQRMETNFQNEVKDINLDWFETFFGQKTQNQFSIILSGLNGGGNYGPSNKFTNGVQTIYSIMGSWVFDTLLLVDTKFVENIKQTIAHEFCHSFCNSLIDKHFDLFKSNAAKMFSNVRKIMKNNAYGSTRTMMYETLVRSCDVKYMIDHNKEFNLQRYLARNRGIGFHWIEFVFNSLNQYSVQRDKYPTLDSFMPELAKEMNKLETRSLVKNFEKVPPKFGIQTSIANGDQNVDPNITELVLTFDRRMFYGRNGISHGMKKGSEYMIHVEDATWNTETCQQWILKIKLEPGKEYSLSFPNQFFCDEFGRRGKRGKHYLDFKTAEK